jgi:transcriptional regulator with PAS, ATPase and Fis domain
VLIQGESGTGKELIAQAIHENSPRRNNPFIVVNCGALTETLLESELFGHVKGAFTGATYTKKGLLEEADGGTLMLDEIGDTSQAFQVKLLRVLQQGEMRKVGSNETLHINVRIIAATNKNLVKLVEQEKFRSDLYYRINVVQVDLPPLAERVEDIPLLAEHFISQYSKEMKKRITGLSPETRQLVLDYPWPGNVRELENAMERAVALAIGHTILPEDLPPNVRQFKQNQNLIDAQPIKPLKSLEKEHIIHALTRYNWDYDRVAQKLGIGRTTLWRKMKDYGISKTAH